MKKTSGQKAPVKAKPRITWDEETIAEHDKLRGTRQKIDEPDTPWSGVPVSVSEDEDEDEAVASGGRIRTSSVGSEGSVSCDLSTPMRGEDLLEKLEGEKKKGDFKAKRKQHYNEFQMLQKWKEEHPSGDEDD